MFRQLFKQNQPTSKHNIISIQQVHDKFNEHNINLVITRKKVKNINFRLKGNDFCVSCPKHINEAALAQVIYQKLPWVIKHHQRIITTDSLFLPYKNFDFSLLSQAMSNEKVIDSHSMIQNQLYLWGTPYPIFFTYTDKKNTLLFDKNVFYITLKHKKDAQIITENLICNFLKNELQTKTTDLFEKWQPTVGKQANEVKIKKMKTRWGTCNTQAKRVWLSSYLAQYPVECTEYVIVHELCHLHEANHSKKFWQHVENSMPNYKEWHQLLKTKEL